MSPITIGDIGLQLRGFPICTADDSLSLDPSFGQFGPHCCAVDEDALDGTATKVKHNLRTQTDFLQSPNCSLVKRKLLFGASEKNLKVVCLFHRYGVLLSQRMSEVSDREQTVALLDMVGAEEGQYQLGLTKVPNCPFCETD